MSVRFAAAVSGGGGLPAGSGYALVFYDQAGAVASFNADLRAGYKPDPGGQLKDPFGRMVLWDRRLSGGSNPENAVIYLGSWTTDGDPDDRIHSGIRCVCANYLGALGVAGQGAYARIKGDRFGLAQITPASPNLVYFYRADALGRYVRTRSPADVLTADQRTDTGTLWQLGEVASSTGFRVGTVGSGLQLAPAPIVIPYLHTGGQDEPILGGGGAPTKGIILAIAVAIAGAPPAGSAQAWSGLLATGSRLSVSQAGWFPGEFSLAGLPTTIASGGPAYFNTANPGMWAGVALRTLFCPLP